MNFKWQSTWTLINLKNKILQKVCRIFTINHFAVWQSSQFLWVMRVMYFIPYILTLPVGLFWELQLWTLKLLSNQLFQLFLWAFFKYTVLFPSCCLFVKKFQSCPLSVWSMTLTASHRKYLHQRSPHGWVEKPCLEALFCWTCCSFFFVVSRRRPSASFSFIHFTNNLAFMSGTV